MKLKGITSLAEPIVDPTSLALRTTLYDRTGRAVKFTRRGYLTNVLVRHTAADAAFALMWSLYNPDASVVITLRAIRVAMMFDGTSPGVQSRTAHVWRTSSTAAPTGGTAITPTKKRTSDAASIADVRFINAVGLTLGALVRVGEPLMRLSVNENITGQIHMFEHVPLPLSRPITLLKNQGVGIFVGDITATTVTGTEYAGYVEWDEV